MLIYMWLFKFKGFCNWFCIEYEIVNVGDINWLFL